MAVAVGDLFLQSRVSEQARASGYETVVADTFAALQQALHVNRHVALVVLDLHATTLDWRNVVALAAEHDVPVLAFGRHTEAALLREARDAGCVRVVPRSALVEELPQLIAELSRTQA
jgi:CheY-like chemotaxis protein